MNKHIIFVTTNNGKFLEVKRWLEMLEPSITLEQAAVDLPEYQSLDVHYVALGKAKEAWSLLQKPLLIDDGGLYIEKYNQFPGALSKYVFEGIGLDGIWLLAQDNPRAFFLNCLVYAYGQERYQLFEGKSEGTLIKPHSKTGHIQLPYTEIFIPDGSAKTFAQLRDTQEELNYHHRLKSIQKLLAWFKEHKQT